ncbi:MAG: hypothetical protein Q9160_007061 [Pyrenula sp. 1 TL-2023]
MRLPSPWSTTIRLPKSNFPVRPLIRDRPNLLQRCTDDYYEWQRTATQTPFILHDGPPYANGSLHIGHALNKILKDIICRTHVSRGRPVQYVPGWDCHGLPIELKALENATVKNDAISIRGAARKLAEAATKEQKAEFRSWAVMGDWSNAWTTMDQRFELDQLRVFQKMVYNGLIHRRNRPVYWSPSSKTALAEAELEYRDDHISLSTMVKLRLSPLTVNETSYDASVVVWTTTPWTLPANMAVAFHREMDYSIVSSSHGYLVIGTNQKAYVEKYIDETLETIAQFPGAILESQCLEYSSPFGGTRSMIHADFVTSDTGSGFVHCAPGHGMEDYEVLQPQIRSGSINVSAPVDDNGCFSDELPSLGGQPVLGRGNTSVIGILQQQGLILATQKYQHKYPYDWRTKKPVIVRATSQWFADVSSIREDTLNALEPVHFHPASAKLRLQSFIRNRSEWCISRQRAWGLPIPALYNITTGEALLTKPSVDHIIKTLNERGTDAWWSDPEDDNSWVAPEYSGKYTRGKDTMDVWFDSGSSWTQLERSGHSIADIYIEGTDQHRGWFQSSLLTHVAYWRGFSSSAPYRSLITHGFTLDRHGKKMSKSLGNVTTPQEIIQGTLTPTLRKHGSLGPDMLRLWVASADFTKDLIVSPIALENVRSFLHKYRLTFKLLLGALEDFDPGQSVEYNHLHHVDQTAIWQLFKVATKVRGHYESFEFHRAVGLINQWISSDFSAFYIESIKDRLYCSEPHVLDRRAAQSVLYNILFELQAMLTPLVPLLVEEVFYYSPKQLQAHLLASKTRLEAVVAPPNEFQLEEAWTYLQALNSNVKALQEKARNEKRIGSSLESHVHIQVPEAQTRASEILRQTSIQLALKDMLVASGLQVTSDMDKTIWAWSYDDAAELPDGTRVQTIVHAPPDNVGKCARCWQYTVDLSKAEVEETGHLCFRCEEVVQ